LKTTVRVTNQELQTLISELKYAQTEQEEHQSAHYVILLDKNGKNELDIVVYPTEEQIKKAELRKYYINDPVILEELYGYLDNIETSLLARFKFWKKVEELFPETTNGTWEYDDEGATVLLIQEKEDE